MFAKSLEDCTTLEKLSVEDCWAIPKQLFSSLGQNENLSYLAVSDCRSSQDCIPYLCDQLKHLKTFTVFGTEQSSTGNAKE